MKVTLNPRVILWVHCGLFNLKVSQQSLPAVPSVCDLSKMYCGISALCEDLGVCFWILQVTPTAKLVSILTPLSCFSHNNKCGWTCAKPHEELRVLSRQSVRFQMCVALMAIIIALCSFFSAPEIEMKDIWFGVQKRVILASKQPNDLQTGIQWNTSRDKMRQVFQLCCNYMLWWKKMIECLG